MAFRLSVHDGFSAAHRIVGSGGKCESLHGHNFSVTLEVTGRDLDGSGMLIDFGVLKKVLRTILSELDHTDLNENPAFTATSPSSENIARYIWQQASALIQARGVRVTAVRVSESDRASATYEPAE